MKPWFLPAARIKYSKFESEYWAARIEYSKFESEYWAVYRNKKSANSQTLYPKYSQGYQQMLE